MPRPKGSKNKPKTDIVAEEKVTRTRKPTVESITRKIESLEKQKSDIDIEIASLIEQRDKLAEEEKAQALINDTLKSMSAVELAELIKKAKGEE